MRGPDLTRGNVLAARYRLEQCLGEGGMGVVWSATHVVTRRGVAMKFLKPSLSHKGDVRQRFLREAQAAGALRHPHVVEVIDVFDLEDGSPVMVMELLEGETLGQKLVRDERLSTEETAALLLPVVAAVGSAHSLGIVHRDLKPENIFIARPGEDTVVKVLDFGIAKLSAEHFLDEGQSVLVTEAGSMLGTPCYMAPEQVSNVGVDHRADIWSLGVILYECLTGTRPIEGQNMADVVSRLLNEAITPLERLAPELSHELAALVQRMLTRDPDRRPQDLNEVATVLARYTHVKVGSFGAPRDRVSSEDVVQGSIAARPSAPNVASAARAARSQAPSLPVASASQGTHGATMQSAPAVGIEGAAQSRPGSMAPRRWLLVAGAALVALAAIWWTSARTVGSNDASATQAAAVPLPGPTIESSPAAPSAAIQHEPVPVPSAVPSATAPHRDGAKPAQRPRPKWNTAPRAAAQAPAGAPASEEILFRGRK